MTQEPPHHVAWADRIGLNKLWARDILACSETFGTIYYVNTVKRFRNDIININNGPSLKTLVNQYIEDTINPLKEKLMNEWVANYPQLADNESYVTQKQDEIDQTISEYLCNFMIQLLEDNGFGFYESTVEEDVMS